jgi:hypothetical protein
MTMAVTVKSLFSKPVDRPIDGVIKADDNSGLLNELEEYVITNEIEKNINKFLSEYNNYNNKNGVWISGFFGSGKSHLLKMLSMMLENQQVEGQKAADIFIKKTEHDLFLKGEIEKAIKIPSKSILFNIDQKATIISKDQVDALLAVFQSVFDQSCGYYREGYIAKLERELDEKGQLEKFKEEFTKYSFNNVTWEEGRETAAFEADAIAKAFAKVTGQSEDGSKNILDHYRQTYAVSIEDFAKQVKRYIDKQVPNFRLNFFVDEVGQYVADNVKLMLNLQTIAESLNTICNGRAWIIVTAQEALEKVVGDVNARQQNDFSKITARFGIRTPLTSQNVAEVIQKRLLPKTPQAEKLLKDLYTAENRNFGTLFKFSDGSVDLKHFRDEDEFIKSYPFVPYQYTLFREAIKGLSEHNCFEGRHSSVGERSMLGVFQEVAIAIADLKLGQLATFDLMFAGISSALKGTVQSSIFTANEAIEDKFTIQVLKALFLVKYYRQFKPTLHNICVLMTSSFSEDVVSLRKRIQEALNTLEGQTFIQRNGDVYEFLTDEEKDVEEEIKSTNVDRSEISGEIDSLIFNEILGSRKITHQDTGADYGYLRKIDDEVKGRMTEELSINVLTPFNENNLSIEALRAKTLATDELLVVLEPDPRLQADLLLYKRTEKYIRQNQRSGSDDIKLSIINDKGNQNTERYKNLRLRMDNMLSKAKLIAKGDLIELSSPEAKPRIERAFNQLIDKVFSNLKTLRGIKYGESDIAKHYTNAKDSMHGDEAPALTEAQQLISDYIQQQTKLGIRVTLSNVEEKFERKSYGWPSYAILSNIAALCGYGKLETRSDSNLLENDQLIKALKNSRDHGNYILEPQIDYSASQIRGLKDFYKEYFATQPEATEAKAIAKETAEAFKALAKKLKDYIGQSSSYPFLSMLDEPQQLIEGIGRKDPAWFYNELANQKDSLLDTKESIVDPICNFMIGSQKQIYDEVKNYLKENSDNFAVVAGNKAGTLTDMIEGSSCYKGATLTRARTLLGEIRDEVTKAKELKISACRVELEKLKSSMQALPDYAAASINAKTTADSAFDNAVNGLDIISTIALIEPTVTQFRETQYPAILSDLHAAGTKTGAGDDEEPKALKIEFVSAKSMNVSYAQSILATEADVEGYLEAYKRELIGVIKAGKRITI